MNFSAQNQNSANISATGTNYIDQQMRPIRISLFDSHPITLLGLKALLTEEAGYEVTGAFQSTNNITEHIKLQKPDIVLIDFHLPNVDSLRIIEQIIAAGSSKVVVMAASLNATETCQLVKIGVKGLLLKEMPVTLIIQCLQSVNAGKEWMERNSIKSAFEKILRREAQYQAISANLSPSEIKLAILIASGDNSRSAAQKLNLSEGSARVYMNRIYTKLNIANRIQLAQILKERELI